MTRRTPEQAIARLQGQLARAKAKQRKQDAHRKITLGGIVIAAGADTLDPAELCGWLLAVIEKRTEQGGAQMRERGLVYFERRKTAALGQLVGGG